MICVTRADDVLVAVRPTPGSPSPVTSWRGQASVNEIVARQHHPLRTASRIDACTLTGTCVTTEQVAANVESAVLSGLDPKLPYFVRV
ncbi:MAG: hypothetical protein R2873_05675 [Caldilineaceae bacterium]